MDVVVGAGQRVSGTTLPSLHPSIDPLADAEVRADLIRQFNPREDARNLADVLIDLEANDVLRVEVIGLLEELENLSQWGRPGTCCCSRLVL